MQNKETGDTPYRLVKKAGMNKPLAYFFDGIRTGHSPKTASGKSAERLLVCKVAPTTDALTYKKAQRGKIERVKHIYLFELTHKRAANGSAYHSAVNGYSRKAGSGAESEEIGDARNMIAGENHVIRSRAEYRHRHGHYYYIKQLIKIKIKPLRIEPAVNNRKQKTGRDNNTVPVHVPPVFAYRQRKRDGMYGKMYTEYSNFHLCFLQW
jgi:hypothetical protein